MSRYRDHKGPLATLWAALFLALLGCIGVIGWTILSQPDSPVPDGWNPLAPLHVTDAVTPFTPMKLRHAEMSLDTCLAALDGVATLSEMTPLSGEGACGIADRVTLTTVGQSRIDPLQTSCAIALRTAMWERHGLQPAALEILGSPLTELRQVGSYSCRNIRTPNGNSTQLSTHATAEAIDITGFDLANGTTVRLIRDWDGDPQKAAFLRAARNSACKWFETTLSPDYNALHADHFHLQSRGWGTCR